MTTKMFEDTVPGAHVRDALRSSTGGRTVAVVEGWGAHTRRGARRSRNEDAWGERSVAGCWVVADGMGGRAGGESAAAVTVRSLLESIGADQPLDWRAAVRRASGDVIDDARERGAAGGGAAFAALVHSGRRLTVAHAGDVRVYRIRTGEVSLLTRDHTVARELELGGVDPSASPFDGRQLDALTCFVGDEASWEGFDVCSHDVGPGDYTLVCTDGVHRSLRPPDMAHIVAAAPSPAEAAGALVSTAAERGAADDATCLTIAFGGNG